jgi:hypothetical protein
MADQCQGPLVPTHAYECKKCSKLSRDLGKKTRVRLVAAEAVRLSAILARTGRLVSSTGASGTG